MSSRLAKWVILVPILAGLAVFVALKAGRPGPVQEKAVERARPVRTIAVPLLTVIPKANGFGSVRPSRTWEAVAQVKGTITYKHPRLHKGAILVADTVLLRIDPTDYTLAIAQAEADIAATQAQIDELEVKAGNTRGSLQIEQAALALSEKELERKRKLLGKGGVSRSDLDAQERSVLAQRQSVQTQANTLNLIPTQKALLEAQLRHAQASLETARRNLAHTEVRLPFTGRIGAANVEQDQYVREGEVLAAADDLGRAEVEVQLPIERLTALVHSRQTIDLLELLERGERPIHLPIQAQLRLREGRVRGEWPARFARLSDTLDPKTRTVGIIVEVDEPYGAIRPGVRPPLVKGLFVEVRLAGAPRPEALAVPRSALHGGRVFVANAQDRLERRPVTLGLVQSGYALVESGLQAGERVVVSDLSPAIEGMLLGPVDDPETLEALRREAEDALAEPAS